MVARRSSNFGGESYHLDHPLGGHFDRMEIFQGPVLRWTWLLVGCTLAHCCSHDVSEAGSGVMGF